MLVLWSNPWVIIGFDKWTTLQLFSSVLSVLFVYRCVCCSLACVKQHKMVSGCCGVQDKTAFVPLAEFNEINLLNGELLRPSVQEQMKECDRWGVLSCRLQVPGGHGPTDTRVQQRRCPAQQPSTPEGGEICGYLLLDVWKLRSPRVKSLSFCLLRACGWSEKPELSKSPWGFCPKCSANIGRTAPSSEERKVYGFMNICLSVSLIRQERVLISAP